MKPDYNSILYAAEIHSGKEIKQYFENGGSPNEVHDGMPVFTMMVEIYARGPRFKDCVQAFIDAGLQYEHQALLAVLAHDTERLTKALKDDASAVNRTCTL